MSNPTNPTTPNGAAGGAPDDTNLVDAALGGDAGAGDDAGEDGIAAIDRALADEDADADGAGGGSDAGDAAAGSAPAAPAGGKEGEADPAAAGQDGKPADAAGKPDAAGKDGKPEGEAGKDGKPQPHADDVAAAKALGLKEQANERFVSMATEIRQFAPMKAALEAAGIKDAAELPKLAGRAKAADDMIAMVMETGADAEQYDKTLVYLTDVNAAMRGDREAGERAFAAIAGEYAALAQALGKEVPGVHDPVAAHADLVDDLKEGRITRDRALETARLRQQTAAAQQAGQQQTQAQQQQQAVEQGRQAIVQWDASMRADPSYMAKRKILDPIVANIRRTLPPGQWLAATQQAYAAIPDIPAPAPAAPPAGQPGGQPSALRSAQVGRTLQPTEFDDPMEALEAALGNTR